MSPVLTIRLLANFQLTYDGEPITHVTSAPMQSLLAYLLIHRHTPQARQYLAYLLWPDSTEAQARTNLRRELHHLRHALPEADRFLQVDGKFLQWRCDAPFTLDMADFEAAAEVEHAQATGGEADLQAALEKAVGLYAGDLLPNCYDDWIVSERERLAHSFARLLEQLIQVLERQRDYALAVRYAQQLRGYDPLRETTYRHLMRLYALNGDRARALRTYHTCVTTLRRELGVDPSPATRESYARLLDLDRASARPSVPVATLVAEGHLVGRQPEWKTLQTVWHSVAPREQPGQAHFLLVTGDAGIGKSRLVEELLEWVGRQGITTAQSRCYATGGELAYAPVADWLATEAFRTALLGVDEVWLTELARLLPILLVERPDLPRPAPLTESGQRLRLFDALAHVILASSRPLLLVIDDLHWCDRETLEWLHYLLHRHPHSPLLVAGTARVAEVGVNHALRRLALDLRSTGQLTEVELGPLSPRASAELAAQVAGGDVDLQQAAHLYAETEGNPLFVVETVRAQWASRLMHDSRAHSSLSSSAPANTEGATRRLSVSALPSKVYAILQAHLTQLSPQARELAVLAATIGRSFTFQVLAQASDSDQELLVRGLDELWQRRIIREQGVDAYDFSHDKIREVAYAEISRARQQLLHRRVAQALETVHAGDLDAVSGQIAAHYERAGLFAPAVRHYQRAAEMARRVYANQEAKGLYTQAVEASRRATPALDEGQLLPLYEGRARVCRSLTQLDDAIADFQTMRRMAQAANNRQQEGESLCQLAYTHWLSFSEDQMPLVQHYAQEAMACFAQTGDQSIRARSLTMLGAVDQVHRKLADAGRKLADALEIGRQTEDKDALVQTVSFLCLQAHLQGNSRATVQLAQEGVAVARQIQDDFNELRILAFLCQGQWSAGNYAQAFTLVRETMAQAEERGNRFVRGRLLNTLGWFHHEFGDLASAIAYNQQSVELGRASGIHNVEISALINLGYDHLALVQPVQALAYLEPTLARVEREGFGAHKWRWQMKLLLGLAEHAASTGAFTQALHYVDAGLEEALSTSSQKYMAKGWALRGKILMRLGQKEAAGAELQRAFALAEQVNSPSLSYPIACALGQWYEARGEARQAAVLYAQAKATVEQMATAVGDEALAALFLQSEPVRMIAENWARTL